MPTIETRFGGAGPLLSLSGTTSTAMGLRYDFDMPLSQFGLQVVTPSTNATVKLFGSAATSSGVEAFLGSFLVSTSTVAGSTGNASGDMIFFTGKPIKAVIAQLDSASSSGAKAWITAVR